jgi:Protein of unknown function (DUF1598)
MAFHYSSTPRPLLHWILLFLFVALVARPSDAQVIQRQIGGVSIDANGAVSSVPHALHARSVESLRRELQEPQGTLGKSSRRRVISLASLENELTRHAKNSEPLPLDVKFLGGLTRVEFLVVDPTNHDILLGGPAEPWTVHPSGDIVGKDTGHPILQLDDLVTAFRAVEMSRTDGITCSIDPTEEGRRSLQQFLRTVRQFHPQVIQRIEQVLGPQVISLTGIPKDSHFANVLVACDYQMKRYAMNLEPAPITGMPGFLELVQSRKSRPGNMMPRWWISCEHKILSRSEDGLVWELPQPSVAVLTEDEQISSDGQVSGTGKSDPIAKMWADNMTEKYDELAKANSMFGQLKNLVDLAVIAALVEKEGLLEKAGLEAPTLFDAASGYQPERWSAPLAVASQGSFVKLGREFVITASGGVELRAWEATERSQVSSELAERHTIVTKSRPQAAWLWDAE